MLHDRDYMREPEERRITAAVALLWILGACYIVQAVLLVHARTDLVPAFGLSWTGVRDGKVWQLLTFQFLHSVPWPWHVVGNCLGLYFFGRSVEQRLGTRLFLLFYVAGGVLGGVFELGMDLLRHMADRPTIGASAGVCALIAAYCRLFAEREATFFFYFFPVTMRSKTFLWIITGFTLLGILIPWDNVAHAAHLGGLALGYFGVGAVVSDGWLANWKEERTERKSAARVLAQAARKPKSTAEFVSEEVDPILDKIAARGVQSLTEEEKRILENAGKKIDRR